MKTIKKSIIIIFIIYLLCIFLYVIFGFTSCTYHLAKTIKNHKPLPDNTTSKALLTDYLKEKYNKDFTITIVQTKKIGFERFVSIDFTDSSESTDQVYSAFIAYDDKDNKTPIIVGENYINHLIEPVFCKYLNELTTAKYTSLLSFGELNPTRKTSNSIFSPDFPIVKNSTDAANAIKNYKLTFEYVHFYSGSCTYVENKINENLHLFADDEVRFSLRKVDSVVLDNAKEIAVDGILPKLPRITIDHDIINIKEIKTY